VVFSAWVSKLLGRPELGVDDRWWPADACGRHPGILPTQRVPSFKEGRKSLTM